MSRLAIIGALFLFSLPSLAEGIDCLSSCSGKPGYTECMRCCTPTGFTCHDSEDATDPNQYSAPAAPASTSASTSQAQPASQNSSPSTQTANNAKMPEGSWMREHQELKQDRAALAGDVSKTETDARAYKAAVNQYGAMSPQAQAAQAALGKDFAADRVAEHEVRQDQRAIASTDGRLGERDRWERDRWERERLERERREARALERKEHHDHWAVNYPGGAAHPTPQNGLGTASPSKAAIHPALHRPKTQVAKR